MSKNLLRSRLNSSSLLSSLLSSGYRPVIVRSGRRQQGGRLWCGGVAVHVEATAATGQCHCPRRRGVWGGDDGRRPRRQQRWRR